MPGSSGSVPTTYFIAHSRCSTSTPPHSLSSRRYSVGATAAIDERFSASKFWQQVRKFHASVFNFMGATLSILWKRPPTFKDRNHRVRLAWGVPMPPWQDNWRNRFGFPLFQVYGLTDAGVPVYDPIDGTQRRGACGRVIEEFEVAIADPI
jgi:crotonobetaine/carnitine-CoA ligase